MPHMHTKSDSRVFVFGSNLLGQHAGGAADYAHRELSAVWGVGEGETGRAYALPTCDAPGSPLTIDEVSAAVDRFLEHARNNPNTTYFVSEVGCGIAGFTAAEIAPLFAAAPSNCDLPPGWR